MKDNEVIIFPPDYSIEFLSFPILVEPDYPPDVYEKAEDIGVSVEVIAESMGLETKKHQAKILGWITRERVEAIIMIHQYKLNLDWSIIEFIDGDRMLIDTPCLELMQRIDIFKMIPYMMDSEPVFPPEIKKTRGRPKKTENVKK